MLGAVEGTRTPIPTLEEWDVAGLHHYGLGGDAQIRTGSSTLQESHVAINTTPPLMGFWSRREDSNPLREAYKATALPVELHRHWYGQPRSNRGVSTVKESHPTAGR